MPDIAEPHVRLSFGLYLLGALSEDESMRIERHLAHCRACLTEAEELSEAAAALAVLTAAERRALIAEFGMSGR